MISSVDDSDWRVVCDTEFNGMTENCFTGTSMHLSFTEYYRPYIQPNGTHSQDSQIGFLESIVAVHYRGTWIGDVDVQKCLSNPLLFIEDGHPCCGKHDDEALRGVLSVETWQDIIDPPPTGGVIRTHGSWLERLAAALIYVQARVSKGNNLAPCGLRVLPGNACVACFLSTYTNRRDRVPTLSRIPGTAGMTLY